MSKNRLQLQHPGGRHRRGAPDEEGRRYAIHAHSELWRGRVGVDTHDRVDPREIKAHIAFQMALNQELGENGELVDAQALAGPDQAKFVLSDGASAPVVTDGPFPEGKELLAGYRIVDVESTERAVELAARISAAPGRGGAPIGQRIEVREVMSAPDPEL